MSHAIDEIYDPSPTLFLFSKQLYVTAAFANCMGTEPCILFQILVAIRSGEHARAKMPFTVCQTITV